MTGKTLTKGYIEELFADLAEAMERENRRTTLRPEEVTALTERGVIIVGNRLIFTEKSRDQMRAALDSGDYSGLTVQQMAALSMMARQVEREDE